MLTGFGEGNTQLRVNGLTLGPGQLDLRRQRPERRRGPEADRSAREGGLDPPPRRPVPLVRRLEPGTDRGGAGRGPSRSPASASSACRTTTGATASPRGTRSRSATSCSSSRRWTAIPTWPRPRRSPRSSTWPTAAGSSRSARRSRGSTANRSRIFNASCGPLIERGGLLPAAYHGNAFVCEPLTNLVHRRVLEPAGVTFVARRVEQGREFLASTDPAFRPVNLANGPDGALYVVDMYRELVEHPQFVPESARGTVDFRRWHDRGRIWRIRPKSATDAGRRRPNLRRADDRTLVALLGNRNAWWRTTAQRLLVERLPQEPLRDDHPPGHRDCEGVAESPGAAPCLVDTGRDRLGRFAASSVGWPATRIPACASTRSAWRRRYSPAGSSTRSRPRLSSCWPTTRRSGSGSRPRWPWAIAARRSRPP